MRYVSNQWILALFVLLVMLAPASGRAATTVFADSILEENGVVNAAGALGAADGDTAIIGGGDTLVLQFSSLLTGDLTTISSPNGLIAFGAVSIGHIVNGVAVYSAEINFSTFGATSNSFDLSAQCAAISATGCNLIRIRGFGGFFSSGVALDGVSGVSGAPEPAQWALMIVGFVLAASRLKAVRRSRAGRSQGLAL